MIHLFLSNRDAAHYTLNCFVWIIIQTFLMIINSMEPVKVKKFVMVGAWWRVETGADCAINNIYENLDSMGFGV